MRLSIDWPPHRLEVANSLIKLKQNHKVIVLNTEWLAEASNKVSITYNPHSEKWQNKPTKLIVISIDALYS